MTEIAEPAARVSPVDRTATAARVRRRYAAERRFRFYGLSAIAVGVAFLVVLFVTIIGQGYSAFQQTVVRLDVNFDPAVIDPSGNRDHMTLMGADYTSLVRRALREAVPVGDNIAVRRQLYALVSVNAGVELRDRVISHPELIGTTQPVWVLAHSDVDMLLKGQIRRDIPEDQRRLNDRQTAWIDQLVHDGRLERHFDSWLFTEGASPYPETAGIGVALIGSAYMMLIVLALSLPIGVATAVYLEEFARKGWWNDLIEVNISNLAAVPSIVFGLLGLAIFINFMGMPRSAPVVGGLVLTLMTLPTVIIATRVALKAVPPSIREAALGVGASKMQTMMHHVVPLAMPGILTGAIIGMARALGETAPLLMIGMVAYVYDYPATPLDPATALPVQIYRWAGEAERGFVERTSAAIIVLLVFMVVMNGLAVVLRRKFERRW